MTQIDSAEAEGKQGKKRQQANALRASATKGGGVIDLQWVMYRVPDDQIPDSRFLRSP